MRIYQNIGALNAHRQLAINNTNMSKAMEKLSSGLRINRAGDDAAGLAISEKMRGQIRGLNQAIRNAQDGISMIQTAEGALNETHAILQRMRELVVQAGNGTNSSEDLQALQDEITALIAEIGDTGGNGIADRTQFNTKNLLDGTIDASAGGVDLQIGANTSQKVTLEIESMLAGDLGTVNASGTVTLAISSINVTSFAATGLSFDNQLKAIDDAIATVSSQRSELGALQNRLEHTIANLGTAAENLAAAESRIRDVDMALEMVNFTKNQILQQAGTAMLAQANATPQTVLQLLR